MRNISSCLPLFASCYLFASSSSEVFLKCLLESDREDDNFILCVISASFLIFYGLLFFIHYTILLHNHCHIRVLHLDWSTKLGYVGNNKTDEKKWSWR